MEDLKHFSDIICGPIIAVHSSTSNDVLRRPSTTECQKRLTTGVARVT